MPWNNVSEIVVASNGQVLRCPGRPSRFRRCPHSGRRAQRGLRRPGLRHRGRRLCDSVTPEVADYMAWQSRSPVRREKVSQEAQVALSLMQWNEQTVPAAFGGGTISGTAGNYRYDLPDDNAALAEVSLILDAIDGSTHMRWVFPRGNVVEAVEAQFQRGNPAALPLTFKALTPAGGGSPGYFFSDNAAFAAGS
jgi:hypothetical protein